MSQSSGATMEGNKMALASHPSTLISALPPPSTSAESIYIVSQNQEGPQVESQPVSFISG